MSAATELAQIQQVWNQNYNQAFEPMRQKNQALIGIALADKQRRERMQDTVALRGQEQQAQLSYLQAQEEAYRKRKIYDTAMENGRSLPAGITADTATPTDIRSAQQTQFENSTKEQQAQFLIQAATELIPWLPAGVTAATATEEHYKQAYLAKQKYERTQAQEQYTWAQAEQQKQSDAQDKIEADNIRSSIADTQNKIQEARNKISSIESISPEEKPIAEQQAFYAAIANMTDPNAQKWITERIKYETAEDERNKKKDQNFVPRTQEQIIESIYSTLIGGGADLDANGWWPSGGFKSADAMQFFANYNSAKSQLLDSKRASNEYVLAQRNLMALENDLSNLKQTYASKFRFNSNIQTTPSDTITGGANTAGPSQPSQPSQPSPEMQQAPTQPAIPAVPGGTTTDPDIIEIEKRLKPPPIAPSQPPLMARDTVSTAVPRARTEYPPAAPGYTYEDYLQKIPMFNDRNQLTAGQFVKYPGRPSPESIKEERANKFVNDAKVYFSTITDPIKKRQEIVRARARAQELAVFKYIPESFWQQLSGMDTVVAGT